MTNAAAWCLGAAERRWPRWIVAVGLVGCGVLAFSLPVASVLSGSAVLIAGTAIFGFRHLMRS